MSTVTKKLAVDIPETLMRRLKLEAKRRGMKMYALVAVYLEDSLRRASYEAAAMKRVAEDVK